MSSGQEGVRGGWSRGGQVGPRVRPTVEPARTMRGGSPTGADLAGSSRGGAGGPGEGLGRSGGPRVARPLVASTDQVAAGGRLAFGSSTGRCRPNPRAARGLALRAAVLAAGLLAFGAGTPAAAEPLTVQGRVLTPEGVAVPGALVQLVAMLEPVAEARAIADGTPPDLAAERARTSSGPDGGYRLAAPEVGVYLVRVSAAERVVMVHEPTAVFGDLMLPPVRLAAATSGTLRVVDAGGRGVPRAWVELRPRRTLPPAPSEEAWQVGDLWLQSDEQGWVRGWFGDRLGRVSAWAPGEVPVTWLADGPARVAGPGGGPGMGSAAGAGASGPPEPLRFAARRVLPVTVRSASGAPVAGAVARWPAAGASAVWPLAITDADGRATLPVPAEGGQVRWLAADGARAEQQVERVAPPAPAGGAQSPAAGASPDAAPAASTAEGSGERAVTLSLPGRLSGQVLRGDDRTPLAGALVWGVGADGLATAPVATDRGGGFALPLEPGAVLLSAEAAGFRGERLRTRFEPAGAGGEGEMVLALEPAATLWGHVRDAAGHGVAAAAVSFHPSEPRSRWDATTTESAADGSFRLSALPAASAGCVTARHDRFAPETVCVETPAAGRAPQPLELRLATGGRLRGRLVDANGVAVAGANVRVDRLPDDLRSPALLGSRASDRREVVSAADGGFELDRLPPGRKQLAVEAAGFAPLELVAELPAREQGSPGPEVDLGELVLRAGALLRGVVVDPAGRPLAGATVAVRKGAGRGIGHDWVRSIGAPDATSGADGHFEVADLPVAEALTVSVIAAGHAGRRVAITLRGDEREPLRIELAPGVDVRGRVVDPEGRAVSQALVWCELAEVSAGPWIGGRLDSRPASSDGTFALAGLPARELIFVASSRDWVESEPRRVNLRNVTGTFELTLTLRRGGSVVGRVTDAMGRPLPKVQIGAGSVRPTGAVGTETDGDGRYRLGPLAPGELELWFRGEGYRPERRSAVVGSEATTLDLVLLEAGEIRGRVVDAEGEPLAAVEVGLTGAGRFEVATTDAAGGFSFAGLDPGNYRLNAAAGARGQGHLAVALADGAHQEVELRLAPPRTLYGRLLGVPSERVLEVVVWAGSEQGSARGVVAADGSFRIEGLAAGSWGVRGRLGEQLAEALVEIGETASGSAGEVVELDFASGRRFAGEVLVDGEPLVGGQLRLEGLDVSARRFATTGIGGRFEISGLPAGRYRVEVESAGERLRHVEERSLLHDDEAAVVAIASATVEVEVRAAASGAPLAAANVLVVPVGAAERNPAALGGVATDEQGRGRLPRLSAGRWQLTVSAADHRHELRELELVAGEQRRELFALEGGEVLELVASGPGGPVRDLWVAALPPGAARDAPPVPVQAVGRAPGHFVIRQLTPGRWTLWLQGDGTAPARLETEVPARVEVRLPFPGGLRLRVPALAATGSRAALRLRDATGTLLHGSFAGPAGGAIDRGQRLFDDLPPGPLGVEVIAPDGTVYRGEVVIRAGEVAELVLGS
jgi:hypothetical protein